MMLAAQPYAPPHPAPPPLPPRRVDRRLQFLQTLGQVQPSAAAWGKVLEGFEAWSARDAGFSFWISLAADQLSRWDDHTRALPPRWLWATLRGEACPPWLLKLVRAVEVSALRGAPAAQGPWPDALATSPLARDAQTRWLGLHDVAALQPQALAALLSPGLWPTLTALSLRGAAMTTDAWDTLATWLTNHRPPIAFTAQGVQLDDLTLCRLLQQGALNRATCLNLRDNRLSDRAAAALCDALCDARCPHMTALDLRGNPIGRAGLDALQRLQAARPGLSIWLSVGCLDAKGLRRWLALGWRAPASLDLSKQMLSPEAAEALIARAATQSIRHLDLSATGTRGLSLRAWLRAPWVALGLERLSLRCNGLSGVGLWPTAALHALRALDMSCNPLRAAGARALAQWALPSLRALDLSRAQLSDDGAQALARAPWWGQLQDLDASCCDLSAAGAQSLLARARDGKLQRLNLSGNPLGDDGARAVAATCAQGGLRWLDLSRCNASADAQILPLTQPNTLAALTTCAALTPAHIRALAASPYLTHLCRLDADWSALQPADLQPLRDSPWVGEPLRAFLGGVCTPPHNPCPPPTHSNHNAQNKLVKAYV